MAPNLPQNPSSSGLSPASRPSPRSASAARLPVPLPSLRAGRRAGDWVSRCACACACAVLASSRTPLLAVRGCSGLFLLGPEKDREQWLRSEPGIRVGVAAAAALAACPSLLGSPCSAEAPGWEGSGASVRIPADGQPLDALRGRATSG